MTMTSPTAFQRRMYQTLRLAALLMPLSLILEGGILSFFISPPEPAKIVNAVSCVAFLELFHILLHRRVKTACSATNAQEEENGNALSKRASFVLLAYYLCHGLWLALGVPVARNNFRFFVGFTIFMIAAMVVLQMALVVFVCLDLERSTADSREDTLGVALLEEQEKKEKVSDSSQSQLMPSLFLTLLLALPGLSFGSAIWYDPSMLAPIGLWVNCLLLLWVPPRTHQTILNKGTAQV